MVFLTMKVLKTIYIYIERERERERERLNRSNMHTFTKWVVEKVNKDNICWSLLKTKIIVVN